MGIYNFATDLYTVYLGGTSIIASTTAFTAPTAPVRNFIGSTYTGLLQAQGLFDDFAIFDRLLTTTEITAIAVGVEAGSVADPSLKFYAKMDGSGTLSPVTYNLGASASKMTAKSTELAGGTNLVADGNMEAANMTSWVNHNTPTTAEKVTTGVLFDTQSLHVIGDAVNDGVKQAITVSANTNYTFSAWLKGNHTGTYWPQILLLGGVSTSITCNSSSSWSRCDLSFKTAAAETSVYVMLLSHDSEGWFDNVSLVPNLVDNGGMEGQYGSTGSPLYTATTAQARSGAGPYVYTEAGKFATGLAGLIATDGTNFGYITASDANSVTVDFTGGSGTIATNTAFDVKSAVASGWTKTSGATPSKVTGRTGTSAQHITVSVNGNGVYLTNPMSVNTYYLLSFWTKASDGNQIAQVYTSSPPTDNYTNLVYEAPGTSWKKISKVIYFIDSAENQLRLATQTNGSGWIEYDDVSITPLDNVATSLTAWAPVNDASAKVSSLSVQGSSTGVGTTAGVRGSAYKFDGSTGYLRQQTTATNIGTLSYVGTDTTTASFTDDGATMSTYQTTSGDAAYMIVVTNSDNTTSWGYMGTASTGNITIYTTKARATRGWNGTAPVAGSKTPVGYEIRKTDFQITGNLTVGAWVKGTGISGDIVSKNRYGYSLLLSGGQLQWQLNYASYFPRSSQTINDNNWHFIVATHDSTTAPMYIDGVQVTSFSNDPSSVPSAISDVSYPLALGGNDGHPWNGSIDSPFVTAEALTSTQILDMYNKGLAALNNADKTKQQLAGTTNTVQAIYASDPTSGSGSVYVGTDTALSVLKLGKVGDYTGADSLSASYTTSTTPAIVNNSVKNVWVNSSLTDIAVGTSGGLSILSPGYPAEGSLTSSIGAGGTGFDTGSTSVRYGTLSVGATIPSGTAVTVYVRSADDSGMSSNVTNWYAVSNGSDIPSALDSHRYVQYQAVLSTNSTSATPTLTSVTVNYSPGPVAPSNFSGTAATNSIAWSWTDNSSNETGFRVYDSGNNLKQTLGAGITFWTESSLSPNTSYTRYVVSYQGDFESDSSGNQTVVTLSTTPTSSNIAANRATSTWYNQSTVTFTNNIAGGFGGEVAYFRYSWDQSSSHTWTGSETQWSNSALTSTFTSDCNSWYLHLKGYNSADTANGTLNLGPFYYDGTAPVASSLSEPSNGTWLKAQDTTFKWGSASDATSGIYQYKLYLDGTLLTTTDNATFQYYLKDTSSTGNLKEGTHTWYVTSVDNAGNTTKSNEFTFTVDISSPTLSRVNLDNIGTKDSQLVVTTLNPTVVGTLTDNLKLNKVELAFYKQNYFLGMVTSESLYSSQTLNLESQSALTYDFTIVPSQNLEYGVYKLTVTGFDKAGNTTTTNLSFQLMSSEQAKTLLALGKIEPTEETEEGQTTTSQSGISLPELEKKALLRKEKEAANLSLLIRPAEVFFVNLASQSLGFGQELLADALSLINQVSQTITHTATYLAQLFNEQFQSASLLANNMSIGIGSMAASFNVWTNNTMPDKILAQLEWPEIELPTISLPFTIQLPQIQLAWIPQIKLPEIQLPKVDLIAWLTPVSESIYSGSQTLNQNLASSQTQVKSSISQTWSGATNRLELARQGILMAFKSFQKPASQSKDLALRIISGTKIAWLTFYAYVIDETPTKITDVVLTEVGPDYAIVSWKTNHLTKNNKVNYGASLTYDQEAWGEDNTQDHKVKITNLQPGQKYFFEVMSLNKNYTYDAFYTFQTEGE